MNSDGDISLPDVSHTIISIGIGRDKLFEISRLRLVWEVYVLWVGVHLVGKGWIISKMVLTQLPIKLKWKIWGCL